MTNRFGKLGLAVLVIVGILAVCTPCASAHISTDGVQYRADTTGWDLLLGCHAGSRTITYKYATGEDSANRQRVKTAVEEAAAIWQNSSSAHPNNLYYDIDGSRTNLSIQEVTSGTAMVTITWLQTSSKDSLTLAEVDTRVAVKDSNNHLISNGIMRVYINTAFSSLYAHHADYTLAHEFGHVFGLKDLDPPDSNLVTHYQLMGYAWIGSSSLPSLPTISDKRGACVILGFHGPSAHTYTYSDITTRTHSRECSKCKGYNRNQTHSLEVISMNPYIQRCACGYMISQ